MDVTKPENGNGKGAMVAPTVPAPTEGEKLAIEVHDATRAAVVAAVDLISDAARKAAEIKARETVQAILNAKPHFSTDEIRAIHARAIAKTLDRVYTNAARDLGALPKVK